VAAVPGIDLVLHTITLVQQLTILRTKLVKDAIK